MAPHTPARRRATPGRRGENRRMSPSVLIGLSDRGERDGNLSLFSGEAGRTLRAGLLAQALFYLPRLPASLARSDFVAAFVAITVAGPRRTFTGLPYDPGARTMQAETTTRRSTCQANRRVQRIYRISQNTRGSVNVERNVLRTTIDAASPGSCWYFSVSTKLMTAAGRAP